MENPRRIYNPVQKDYVTFLKTSEETNGECTLVEVELSPKGGVGLHFHKTYSEKFDCLDTFGTVLPLLMRLYRTADGKHWKLEGVMNSSRTGGRPCEASAG